MRIDFTWWQLLLISVVIMFLFWLLIFLMSKSKVNVKTHEPKPVSKRVLYAFYAGLASAPLFACSLGALLPTYTILDSESEHSTKYVFAPATLAEELFGIYVENKTGKAVELGYVEYGNDNHASWPLADGQKIASKKEPEYFFEAPPAKKKIRLLDFGVHRAYYVVNEDMD